MHYIVVLPNDATNLMIFLFVFVSSILFIHFFASLSRFYQHAIRSYARYHHLTIQRLESAAMVSKSDIAATKLRYEQQVYNLQTEISAQQV